MRLFRILVITVCTLLSCPALAADPLAREGILDLSDWDFETDGTVNLRGEYEFYWQELLEPADLLASSPTVYAPVPAPWNDLEVAGEKLGGHGFATYRLNILLPRSERLALKLLDFGTSAWLYIDGELMLQAGQPGRSARETIGGYAPQLLEFQPQSTRIELVLQVANFDHRQGGVWERLILGTPKHVHDLRENAIAMDVLLVGALCMAGLINIGIFFFRRDIRSSLFLAFICFCAAVRLLTVGERFGYLLLAEVPWSLLTKLEYLSWYLLLPAFAHYMYETFRQEVNFKVVYLLDGISLLAVVTVLAADLDFHSRIVPAMQVIHLLALAYGAWCLVNAWFADREGAGILIGGYVVLCFTSVNDILMVNYWIENDSLMGTGIIAFIACQGLVIISQFARTLTTVEQQHEQLFQTNLRLQMQEKLRAEAENESREVSQQFRQSQQFEALGVLAHEVVSNLKRNITDSANESARLARDTSNDPRLVASTEELRRTAQQSIGVIEDVLSLSRLKDSQVEVGLNEVVNDYLDSPVSSDLSEQARIRFERSITPGLPPLSGSALHIRRILENLITNAVDSQPQGGRVVIATDHVHTEARQLFYDELSAGHYLILSVEDDGVGIPPEELDLIFQPFYSSKDAENQATGLGMSVVKAIVRQHSGGIDVASNQDQGTRFDIYLPTASRL